MKKLITVFLLALAVPAVAAIITASGTATTSSGTGWTGGVAPNCTGDQIASGGNHVTISAVNNGCIIGVKSSGLGFGLNASVSGGLIDCEAGVTNITLRGFDATTNGFLNAVANSGINFSNCGTVNIDGPTNTYITGTMNGAYTDAASTIIQMLPADISWNNAGSCAKASVAAYAWDKTNGIYVMHLCNGASEHAGEVANAANTALGSFGDTSILVTAGGFDSNGGTTHVEKSSYVGMVTNGDFFCDYKESTCWYKSSSGVLTVTVTYKYHKTGGWGILAEANANNENLSINGTYKYCGDMATATEASGGGWMINNHYAPGQNDAANQKVTFGSGIIFDSCSRPLMLYSDSITGSSALHHYTLASPQFLFGQYASGNFQNGNIQIGASFLDITNPVLNGYTNLFNGVSRNSPVNINITGAMAGTSLGHVLFNILPVGAVNSNFSDCAASPLLSGFNNADLTSNGNVDGAWVSGGGAVGQLNTYKNCNIAHAYRAGRINNYMDIENLVFTQANHHGFIMCPANQYLDGSTVIFKNNITADLLDTGNFPGGATFDYNQVCWNDSMKADHMTFDGGLRSLNMNDTEATVALITRAQMTNSILSNNNQGIINPAGSATNVVSLAIAKNDYNLDFNNTTTPTNITQATFMRNAAEYNTGTRNVTGVYLFNPQGYSLPDATSRSLVSTVSGTLGTRASGAINIAWSGGTGVNFIFDEGTLSAYSAAGSCPDGSTCSLLTDSTATWTASSGSAAGLRTYQVIIVAGTGVGQYCMVASNTATAITCIANRIGNNVLTTPLDATSKYILIKPDQPLFDSGAVNSVRAGIHSPTLVLTTQTDSGITMALNRPASANPNYVNSAFPAYNFHPKLSTLNGTASDGTFIGALPLAAGGCGLLAVLGAGC